MSPEAGPARLVTPEAIDMNGASWPRVKNLAAQPAGMTGD
jgi:hypothetical protein